jgi:hypothetical protein
MLKEQLDRAGAARHSAWDAIVDHVRGEFIESRGNRYLV